MCFLLEYGYQTCFLSRLQRKWSISVFTSCVFDPLSARIHFLTLWLKFQLHFQVIKQETWLVGYISMISSGLGKGVQLDENVFLWLTKIILKHTMGKRAKAQHTEAVHMKGWGLYYIAKNWNQQFCLKSSYMKIRLHSGRKRKQEQRITFPPNGAELGAQTSISAPTAEGTQQGPFWEETLPCTSSAF